MSNVGRVPASSVCNSNSDTNAVNSGGAAAMGSKYSGVALVALPIDFGWAVELVDRGGPIVVILGLLSIAAVAVALLKFAQFTVRGVGRGSGIQSSLEAWRTGEGPSAMQQLARRSSPAARVLHNAMAATSAHVSEAAIREDSERLALEELSELRSHLRVLEATSQLAPLLGLFGTVIGMMSAFQALQTAGSDADPAALAGGIWVALITTAVGLAVAIPTSFVLYWFEGRIERERTLIETSLTRFLTASEMGQATKPSSSPRAFGASHAAE